MAEQLATTNAFRSGLQKYQETYLKSIVENLRGAKIELNGYQRQCVLMAIQKMNDLVNECAWKDNSPVKTINDVDQSSITSCLQQVALMELNVSAYPSEGFISLRGKQMIFSPQGDGWRTLTEKYGRNVKNISEPWVIREDDEFHMPKYLGRQVTPPEWSPAFPPHGKAILVVYSIEKDNGELEWVFSTREDVKSNLLAHINNNLLKDKENGKKIYESILAKSQNMTLDDMLTDKSIILDGKISPSWRGASKEAMIIRKMKNNALKPYPKDYGDTLIAEVVAQASLHEDDIPTIDVSQNNVDETINKKVENEMASLPSPKTTDINEFTMEKEKEKAPVAKKADQKQKEVVDDYEGLPF